MNTENPTPGTWYAMLAETGGMSDQANVFSDHETDGEPTLVADTMPVDDNVPLEQRRANARLIAASKQMLAALREWVKVANGPNNLGAEAALRLTRAVIAEAEGRSV